MIRKQKIVLAILFATSFIFFIVIKKGYFSSRSPLLKKNKSKISDEKAGIEHLAMIMDGNRRWA
ncbi:hypothetical protein ACFLY6_02155, partial [Candidatus Dependentiae bacterium]